MKILIFSSLFFASVLSFAQNQNFNKKCNPFAKCEGPRECRNSPCFFELKKQGWIQKLECHNGHNWKTLWEKGSEKMECSGANALAGPTDHPCKKISVSLDQFKKCEF